MTGDNSNHAAWLDDAKRHLLLLREEMCLSEHEALVVSRGIAAIERFADLGKSHHG